MGLVDEEVELEVAPGELHAAGDGCPLAEGDGPAVGGAIGEGVAADDVFLEHISQTLRISIRAAFTALLRYHFGKQPLTTYRGVVLEQLDAIAGTHGDEAAEFPVGGRLYILQKGEFAAQNFNKEIAVTAGGLEEAAVEPVGLVAHQVEHSVHLAGIGEHLAVLCHPLAALDLRFRVFVAGHKKIVELYLTPS